MKIYKKNNRWFIQFGKTTTSSPEFSRAFSWAISTAAQDIIKKFTWMDLILSAPAVIVIVVSIFK